MEYRWAIALGICVGARAIAACNATPDLNYGEQDATTDDTGGFDATQNRPDTSAGIDSSQPPDSAQPGSDGASPPDASDGGARDVEPDVPAVDASSDACPAIDAGDAAYGCCPNVGVICVAQSCQHCGDCANAGCKQTEYCCPDIPGGSGNYKGTLCKSQVTCP